MIEKQICLRADRQKLNYVPEKASKALLEICVTYCFNRLCQQSTRLLIQVTCSRSFFQVTILPWWLLFCGIPRYVLCTLAIRAENVYDTFSQNGNYENLKWDIFAAPGSESTLHVMFLFFAWGQMGINTLKIIALIHEKYSNSSSSVITDTFTFILLRQ